MINRGLRNVFVLIYEIAIELIKGVNKCLVHLLKTFACIMLEAVTGLAFLYPPYLIFAGHYVSGVLLLIICWGGFASRERICDIYGKNKKNQIRTP